MADQWLSPDLEQQTSRPNVFWRFALAFALIAGLSWAHRIAIMMIYFGNSKYAMHVEANSNLAAMQIFFGDHATALNLGLTTDVLFALPVAILIALTGRLGLALSLPVLAVFYAANAEHVRYNESHIDPALIGLAANPTFISGQTTTTLIYFIAGFLAGGLLLLWFARRQLIRLILSMLTFAAAIVLLVLPASARYDQPIWIQTHPLMPRIGIPDLPTDDRTFAADPLTDPPTPPVSIVGQHNVLIVFLEGLSEYSIEKYQMETVRRLADQNLHFRQYIGHQLLTANGIYATHTGHLPYFTNVPMRWYALDENAPDAEVALPRLLREEGYHTAFIQSAPLSFMRKDAQLPLLGYEELIGSEDMPRAYARNGWGVDDLTLFETALERIDQFETDQKWFISLLTTGTHSPYNVPADFQPEITNDRMRAARYADFAVGQLLSGLKARGLLENTVVIVTSDESREYSGGTALEVDVHRNWLPFVVAHPNGLNEAIETPFAMMDVRDMVLVLTGDPNLQAINRIAARREIFMFGNVRLSQLFYYDVPNSEFFSCDTDQFICFAYEGVTDLRDLARITQTALARFPSLEALFRTREGAQIYCADDLSVCEQ